MDGVRDQNFLNKEEKEIDIEKEEANQKHLEGAFLYISTHQYPEGAGENRKRIIRKKAAKFVEENGVLKYKMKRKNKVIFITVAQYHSFDKTKCSHMHTHTHTQIFLLFVIVVVVVIVVSMWLLFLLLF